MQLHADAPLIDDALLQQAKMHSLGVPDKWDLRELQHFLETPDMGPLALIGDDATIWGSVEHPKAHSPDIIALRPRPEEDPFSSWLAENAITSLIRCGCSRWKQPSRVHGVIGYQDNSIFRITLGITSIVASLIPLASVAVLYSIPSIPARIGVIGAFNLIIAISLTVFTKVKRSDMFAISAAYVVRYPSVWFCTDMTLQFHRRASRICEYRCEMRITRII